MMLFRITEITRFELLRFQNNKQKLTNLAVTLPNLRITTSTKMLNICNTITDVDDRNKLACRRYEIAFILSGTASLE